MRQLAPVRAGSEYAVAASLIKRPTPEVAALIQEGALDRRGRLLAPAAPWDLWFNPLVMIDTGSGRTTRVPAPEWREYDSAAWLPDGRIVALQVATRATLWKFTSEPR